MGPGQFVRRPALRMEPSTTTRPRLTRRLTFDISVPLYEALVTLAAAESARVGRPVSVREVCSGILCVALPIVEALPEGLAPGGRP